uniref:Extended FMRFamide-9 n=1 Tax=Lobatophasma redelinghuysense TaxID=253128 RepID=FAR9_LOBRE|nr:RecName: Full=Extended FMRFamide-9; Short=FMRFa-9 [Lobatophasma redelinghuysense]
GHGGASNYVRL